MMDAGLLAIALALYFGLKAIASAIERRKIDVSLKLGTINFVHHSAPVGENEEAEHA